MAKASCVMTSDEEGLTGSLMLSQVRVKPGRHYVFRSATRDTREYVAESSPTNCCCAIAVHQRTARAERATCMVHSTPYPIELCVCDASLLQALSNCTKTFILWWFVVILVLRRTKKLWKSANNLEATSSMSLNLRRKSSVLLSAAARCLPGTQQ